AEVAAGGAERQDARPRVEMVERLLFDGIEAEPRRAAVRREHHLPADVLADEAERALAVAHLAKAGAKIALDPAVRERVPPAAGEDARVHGEKDNSWHGTCYSSSHGGALKAQARVSRPRDPRGPDLTLSRALRHISRARRWPRPGRDPAPQPGLCRRGSG